MSTKQEIELKEAFKKLMKAKQLEIEAITQYYEALLLSPKSAKNTQDTKKTSETKATTITVTPVVKEDTTMPLPVICTICNKEIHDQVHDLGQNKYMCDMCFIKNVKISAVQAVKSKEIKTNFAVVTPEAKKEASNESINITETTVEEPKKTSTETTVYPIRIKDTKDKIFCTNCHKEIKENPQHIGVNKYMCPMCYKAYSSIKTNK